MSRNNQLLYNFSGLVLKVEVVEGGNKKVFKDMCNITDKKELSRIFNILEVKFNINIPEALKTETGWFLG